LLSKYTPKLAKKEGFHNLAHFYNPTKHLKMAGQKINIEIALLQVKYPVFNK